MCGIVCHYHKEKNVDPRALTNMYVCQRTRGTDGYGFAYVTAAGIMKVKRFVHEAQCFVEMGAVKSKLILLHHRHPTSTKNVAFQNHPICRKTDKATYVMVHNGVIANDDEVREDHHKGIKYATEDTAGKFNDSEVLLHELIAHLEDGTPIRAQGSMAFILLVGDTDAKLQKIYYGRNTSNPLYHFEHSGEDTKGLNTISSEYADAKYTEQVDPDELVCVAWPDTAMTKEKCVFPIRTYTAPAATTATTPKWSGGTGFHQKRVRHGKGGKKSDKASETVERRMAQECYSQTIRDAEELLALLSVIPDPRLGGDIYERAKHMRNIVDMIAELETYSIEAYGDVTRRAEGLQLKLRDERNRFLEHVTHTESHKVAMRQIDEELDKQYAAAGYQQGFSTDLDAPIDGVDGFFHPHTGEWIGVPESQRIGAQQRQGLVNFLSVLSSERRDAVRSQLPAPKLPDAVVHVAGGETKGTIDLLRRLDDEITGD